MTINIEELIGSSAGVENKNIVFVEMAIGSSHQITTETEAVEFGFDENMIVESTRSGDDLVLELANGEVIRLLDYYVVEAMLAFAPAAGLAFNALGIGSAGALGAGALALGAGGSDSSDSDDGVAEPTIFPTFSDTDSPVLEGLANPGDLVRLTVNDAVYETIADPETGAFSVDTATAIPVEGTFTGLAEGEHAVSLETTGVNGEIATASATATIDLPPEAATIEEVTPNESGTVTIAGRGEAGATIELTLPNGEIATIEVGPEGTYVYTSTEPLPSGEITVRQIDQNGVAQTEPAATENFDVTAPESPSINPTDGTSLSGAGEPGATVTITYGEPEVTLTAPVDPNTGLWFIAPLEPSIPHDAVVTATQVDPAGNTSTPAEETVDAEIATPTVNAIETNDTTPTLTGTAEAGSTVAVTVGGATFEVEANSDGEWELNTETATPVEGSPAFTALTDGDHEVVVKATDAAGNTATDASTAEIAIDTSIAAPTVNAIETNDTTPVLTGTAEAGATVEVTVGGATFEVEANSDGEWELNTETATPVEGSPAFTALTDGDHEVALTATDAAGNSASDTTTGEITIDTMPPQVTIASLMTGLDTVVAGTAEVGSGPVSIYDADDNLLGTAPVDGDGNWTFTPETRLEDGAEITATQTDAAGNTGSDTGSVAWDLDGDGVANTIDIDDDDDGILDTVEGSTPNTIVFSDLIQPGNDTIVSGFTAPSNYEDGVDFLSPSAGNRYFYATGSSGRSGVADFEVPTETLSSGNNQFSIDVGTRNASVLPADFTITLMSGGIAVGELTGTPLAEPAVGWTPFTLDVELTQEQLDAGLTVRIDVPEQSPTGFVGFDNFKVGEFVGDDDDNDGIVNALDTDSDNGGIDDNAEAQYNQAYVAPLLDDDGNSVDIDGDGLNDAYDEDLDGAEGSIGLVPADTDGDGTADVYQGTTGSDELPVTLNPLVTGLETLVSGTGVVGATIVLTDENGDTIALIDEDGNPVDPAEIIVDENGNWSATPATPLAEGAEVTATQSDAAHLPGETSEATLEIALDTDADGVANTVDIDDDNDGILDVNEVDFNALGVETANVNADTGTLQSLGQTIGVTVEASDGAIISALSAAEFLEVYEYAEGSAGTITTGFDAPVSTLTFSSASLNSGSSIGNFTAILADDTVVSNLDFEIGDALTFTQGSTLGLVERGQTGEGIFTINPGSVSQSGGDLTFPVLSLEFLAAHGGISEFSFDVIGGSSTGVFNINASAFPTESVDNDNDGIVNSLDTDSDNGGIDDNVEAQYNQAYVAPLLDEDGNSVDVDGDGLNDAYDEDLDGAEGSIGLVPADTDGDGTADVYQGTTGSDELPVTLNPLVTGLETLVSGTGVVGATIVLTDENGDTIALIDEDGNPVDPAEITVDENGNWSATPATPLAEGAEVTATQSDAAHLPGETSDATLEIALDTDADGVANTIDIDDDNDGILDVNESATLFANEFGGTFGVLEGTENVRDLESPVAGYTFTASNNAAGQYAVVDAQGADNFHGSLFGHLGDSSGDPDGAFLVINGGTTQGAFFSEQVTLTADTDYDFGFSAANGFAGGGNPFEIGMRIFDSNDALIESFSPGELVNPDWVQSSSAFNTGSETEFTIELFNISTQASGNDFAVDDIFVRPTDGGVVSNDIDNDGIINALDTDSDNGGIDDNVEAQYNQAYVAPLLDEDGNSVDVDGDGLNDAYDEDLDGAEGSIGLVPADTDGDGTADVYQGTTGSDELPVTLNPLVTGLETLVSGTGVVGATIVLTDENGDTIALIDEDGNPVDPAEIIVDENGNWSAIPATPLAEGAEVTATQSDAAHLPGETSEATLEIALDTDADGVANTVDIDDDNDGILDEVELAGAVQDFEWFELDGPAGNTVTGTANGVTMTYTSTTPVIEDSSIYNAGTFPAEFDLPTGTVIRNTAANVNTITFDTPVENPTLLFASIGNGSTAVPVEFAQDIEIQFQQGIVSSDNDTVQGQEGYAIVTIPGVHSEISFEYTTAENYANFAIGFAPISGDDADEDGIINSLDTDSDNGGVSDLVEAQVRADLVGPNLLGDPNFDDIPTGAVGNYDTTPWEMIGSSAQFNSNSELTLGGGGDIEGGQQGFATTADQTYVVGFEAKSDDIGAVIQFTVKDENGVIVAQNTSAPTASGSADFTSDTATGDQITFVGNGENFTIEFQNLGPIAIVNSVTVSTFDADAIIQLSGVDENGNGLDDAFEAILGEGVGLTPADQDNNGTADYLETANGSDVDTDGDGVYNHIDNDDDNDGILDVDEDTLVMGDFTAANASRSGSAGVADLFFDHNSSPFPGSLELNNIPGEIESAGTVSYGEGLAAVQNGPDEDGPATDVPVENLSATTVQEALDADQQITLTFETADNPDRVLALSQFEYRGGWGYRGDAAIVLDGEVVSVISIDGTSGVEMIDLPGGPFLLENDTEHTVQFVPFNYSGPADPAIVFDSFGLNFVTADVSGSNDADGDGILNSLDIDSDNDGILDGFEIQPATTVDLPQTSTSPSFGFHQNITTSYDSANNGPISDDTIGAKYRLDLVGQATANVPDLNTDFFSADLIDGALGAGMIEDNQTFFDVGAFSFNTVNDAHLDPFANDHYVQFAWQMQEEFPDPTQGIALNSINQIGSNGNPGAVTLRLSNDNFETFTEVLTETQLQVGVANIDYFDDAFLLQPGETYQIRMYFHGDITANIHINDLTFGTETFALADFGLEGGALEDVDTDNDGIVNRLDIDSDNDGISDREEVELDATELAALESGTANTDGYLLFEDTADLTFDLGNTTEVSDLEYINMDGTTGQEITISEADVLNVTPSDSLIIFGDAADTVNLSDFTDTETTQNLSGTTFDVYQGSNGVAEILVEDEVAVII